MHALDLKAKYCQVKGCNQKVKGWTQANNWALRGTCLLELKGDGKPKTLKDGRTFGRNAKTAKAQLKAMEEEEVLTLPLSKTQRQKRNKAARKAAAEKRDVSEPQQDEKRGAKRAKAVELTADPASEVIYYEG